MLAMVFSKLVAYSHEISVGTVQIVLHLYQSALSINSLISRIETALTPECPFRSRRTHVILRTEWLTSVQASKECVVIDECYDTKWTGCR